MARNKQEINIHTKRYVQAVFEKRLREEGFVCPDDKLLCWYRIKDETIVNSIIFYSAWSNMPVMLSIGYGIYPLFHKPPYTNGVNFPQGCYGQEEFTHQPIVENYPISNMAYTPFSDGIWVCAPGHDGKGIYTFDSVLLPKMDAITTIESCYQRHKAIRESKNYDRPVRYNSVSDTFVDEAIYMDDRDVYPYFENSIERHIAWFQKCYAEKTDKKKYQQELQKWELRKSALLEGAREDYLHILERNRIENLAYMKKKRMIV